METSSVPALLQAAMRRHRAGQLSGAEPLYLEVLRSQPDNGDALLLLGSLYADCGCTAAALHYLHRAVAAAPGNADAFVRLARLLAADRRSTEAEDCCRRALTADPDHADALRLLAGIVSERGRCDEAAALLARACAARPGDYSLLNELGMALRSGSRPDEAAEAYRRALAAAGTAARPEDLAVLHNNLGNAHADLRLRAAAETHLRQAVALDPTYPDAWANLAAVLQAQGQFDEALDCYDRALALRPGMPAVAGRRAPTLLLRGDYARGFRDYENRFECGTLRRRELDVPPWDGGELAGRTILIHAEQGLGDTIQFARYVPLVARRGGRVAVECQLPLCDLIRRVEGVADVIPTGSGRRPPVKFDCHAPLPSLPYLFGTTVATIPADAPYLAADPDRLATWRSRLEAMDSSMDRGKHSRLRVGLVWAGNPTHPNDDQRSCPAAVLDPLAAVPGTRFYSLQKGDSSAATAPLPHDLRAVSLGPDLRDFDDTAAVMACLDLVISVDTSPAHLAGALGRPVWTLLPHVPDWRWMEHRADSPWYPTMRLFRQPRPGDWAGLIRAVVEALAERAART